MDLVRNYQGNGITTKTKEPQEDMQIKILIISDSLMRVGIRTFLESQQRSYMVLEANTDNSSVRLAEQEQPNLILLDLDLFMNDVTPFIVGLHKVSKKTSILLLSSFGHDEMIRKAITAGAVGIVLKVQPPGVLLAAIESQVSNPFPSTAMQQLSPSSPLLSEMDSKKINSLTIRERSIIELIGEGLNNKAIADRLCISDTTVRHHLSNIFNKLNVPNRHKLLILAHHYRLVDLNSSA